MFRLVGSEGFHIGKKNKLAEITISSKGMSFEYTLTVDGKPLEKFVRAQAKNTRTWLPKINGTDHRVVLGENSNTIFIVWLGGNLQLSTRQPLQRQVSLDYCANIIITMLH